MAKSASVFLVFFLLVLTVIEVPKMEARQLDEECLKVYEDAPLAFCIALIFPTLCYHRCREDKEALGGHCKLGKFGKPTCYCDYCSDKPLSIQMKSSDA
ncbi:PREDICTED: defensin-like protein 194 [Tarenaya hassleriana]|uniref:defensin-like protein 194 n=1 Tax=Tarenaya hassleriana TaxID=28532 RepID=UPI00053CA671|nr:PREDICTED: defensin-like protein 194 [Tarenaya hassleriana]